MVEVKNSYVPFLPDLAARVAVWFPELKGRALAVSEAVMTKENVGTLPLAILAFTNGRSDQATSSKQRTLNLSDTFILEFMLSPNRYKRGDSSETPFWSFYDYASFRNRLLAQLYRYTGPHANDGG